jgi:elongation factor P
MPKASELKRGMYVEIDSMPHVVKQVESKSPSSRGASTLYKIRFNNIKTGQKLDESYKSDDLIKEADFNRVDIQYSYKDGDNYIFMNSEDFSQYELNASEIQEAIEYLTEGLQGMSALVMDDEVIGIELPQSIEMKIIETSPAIKGATASSITKPATLKTGKIVQVPEYLETGEVVKINTETGKFMSRA